MPTDAAKAVVRRYIEMWDGRALASDPTKFWSEYEDVVNTDYVVHSAGQDVEGLEAFKEFCSPFYAALPDHRTTVNFVVAEGDRVAAHYTARGTHEGAFAGAPATGNEIVYSGVIICRLEDGRIAEVWSEFDTFGLMRELGVVPSA